MNNEMQLQEQLSDFLGHSLSPYHARDNAKALLIENGFTQCFETDDFILQEGGKYFVERGASLIAFTLGNLDRFTFKIAASHVDSPALKIKENPLKKAENCTVLNVEPYGGGVWYTFFDRPLRIAGRVIVKEGEDIVVKTVTSPFCICIPSQAIHMNRTANEGFAINAQIDLCPVLSLSGNETAWLEEIACGEQVISHDLYVVNADMPHTFGVNNEFLLSPRIDNLSSAVASLHALIAKAESEGVCVAALMHHEEIGSHSAEGADGDFLQTVLRRICYALHFDDNELYKAYASSFLLSVDNAHAVHPNHPEKSDPTNRTLLGGGVALKSHANGAYTTNGIAAAVVKTIFDKAGVTHQPYFNRSDMRSGSTLGPMLASQLGMHAADIGIAQLAMHSAAECFVLSDFTELMNGLTAFFSSNIVFENNTLRIL